MKLKFIYEISNFGPQTVASFAFSTARNDIYNTFTAATEWSRANTEFMTLLQCEGNLCKSDKMDKAEEEAPFEK